MRYDIAYYNKILPQDRETLVALIKFLFDNKFCMDALYVRKLY